MILKFTERLHPNDFMKHFTECINSINSKGMNTSNELSLKNLINNYKTFYEDYKTNTTLSNSMIFWLQKHKFNDKPTWDLLQSTTISNLNTFDGKNLVIIAGAFQNNSHMLKTIEEFATSKLHIFDTRTLSEFALKLNSRDFLLKVYQNNRLLVSNGLDLLCYLKACNVKEILIVLEGFFKEVLMKSINTQTVCGILYEFSVKNHALADDSLVYIENYFLDIRTEVNFKDFHHLLMCSNTQNMHARLSKEFWQAFLKKISGGLEIWPAAILLNYCVQEGLFIDEVFQRIINRWTQEVDRNNDYRVFREGFCALAQSEYFSEEIAEWSRIKFKKLSPKLGQFDILQFARALTIQNNYDPWYWDPLFLRIQKINVDLLDKKVKSLLYHIYKSIEIDKPQNYESRLSLLSGSLEDLSNSYQEMKKYTKSLSQQYIGKILRKFGYEILENQYIADFYEIDLLIPSYSIAVEVVGKPYHISQFNNKLYPKNYMKIRHLNKLGYKVVLVSDKETAEDLITKAIDLSRASNQSVSTLGQKLSLISNS